MADSNDVNEYSDDDWVFYRNRPEWKDVVPVPQDDEENPVVSISYSDKFKDVYDYFRAILKSSEKSERALALTKDALQLNPANYTVWQYRRDILKELKSDLHEELCLVQQVIDENPKNYQVWHHRRVIVEWLQDASNELPLTAIVLQQEPKNYHAWQHRQWAIKTFNLFDKELDYVNELLEEDLRNNSAWNQRYFVINNTSGFTENVIQREIEYTFSKIELANDNESAWNYLRGLLLHETNGLSKNSVVARFCEDLYKSGNRSPFLLALIIDMCEEQPSDSSGDSWFSPSLAKHLCKELADEHDTIREKYWQHVANTWDKGAESSQDANAAE